MRITKPLLLLLALLVVAIGASESRPMNLRGGVRTHETSTANDDVQDGIVADEASPNTNTRKLQNVATTVLNSLLSVVAPSVSEKITYAVTKYYNSYDFEWLQDTGVQTTTNLGSAAARKLNNDTVCGGSDLNVQVKYELKSVTGLGEHMTIDSIAFVPGSQDIELVFQGFQNGAKWSGQWVLDVSVGELTANVNTKFNTTCEASNQTLHDEQSVDGTMIFRNIKGQGIATIYGDTDRVVFFPTTSQLSSAHVDSLTFAYDVASTTIAFSNATTDLGFDAEEVVSGIFHDEVAQKELDAYFQSLYIHAIQDEINWMLPRPLVH